MSKSILLIACSSLPTVFGNAVKLQFSPRADSCGAPSFVQCAAPDLPPDFCCAKGTKCIPFNNANSIICCPTDGCDFIAPISCDISQQDAKAHPQAAIKTSRLKTTLSECGDGCCPEGYTCEAGQCSILESDDNTSLSSSSASPESTSSPKSSTSSMPSSSPTSTISSDPSATSNASDLISKTPHTSSSTQPTTVPSNVPALENLAPQCKAFPPGAVLLGFFLGIFLGLLLALGVFSMCARRKKRDISPPIHQPENALRTDFLRSRVSEARSMEFMLADSPPRGSRVTAFTDLMEGAGFKKGEPYVIVEGHSGQT
ncbi:MAG: hypothetical protein M1837_004830 [Sclerophora amabilis]|nr:MAG: hypothetical protein M1837_004830 [Sclerophora amabilis]